MHFRFLTLASAAATGQSLFYKCGFQTIDRAVVPPINLLRIQAVDTLRATPLIGTLMSALDQKQAPLRLLARPYPTLLCVKVGPARWPTRNRFLAKRWATCMARDLTSFWAAASKYRGRGLSQFIPMPNDHDAHTAAEAFVVALVVCLLTSLLTVHYAPAVVQLGMSAMGR